MGRGTRTLAWPVARAVDPAWRVALREAGWAVLASRALVWCAGIGAVVWWGRAPDTERLDPAGVTEPFGGIGDLLVAPAARWDSAWFLSIAELGYGVRGGDEAFFPLYPTLVSMLGWSGGSRVLAGVLVSMAALTVALVILHRLVALERDGRTARLAVVLVAFFPTAVFLSAVYSEALFLALSLGAVYAARTGRWGWAGVLAGLAASTRSAGVLLLVPLAILYLYGPRADRPARRPPTPDGARGARRLLARVTPRYPLRRSALCLLAVPAGLLSYLAYLALAGGDPFAPFASQDVWHRHFVGPVIGVVDALDAAVDGARQLLSGSRHPVYFTEAVGDPFVIGARNLVLFGFLVFALAATAGALRRLPLAYGAYALSALMLPLSFPVTPQPLMSLPRFLVVLFPLQMWLAVVLAERGRLGRGVVIALSAAGLVAVTAIFATWRWFS